jgi:mRNA interferase YafQ
LRGVLWTNQFKKDYKRAIAQGRDIKALRDMLTLLAREDKLPGQYKDHPLRGDWNQSRDCHIKADWVLIYRITGDTLILARMGSHSELFR